MLLVLNRVSLLILYQISIILIHYYLLFKMEINICDIRLKSFLQLTAYV